MDRRSVLKGLCGLGSVAAVPGVVSAATAKVSCSTPNTLVLANEEIVRIIGRAIREPGEPHARIEWRSLDATTPGNRFFSQEGLMAWSRLVNEAVHEHALMGTWQMPFTALHNSATGTRNRALYCSGNTDAQAAARIMACVKWIVADRNAEWKARQDATSEPIGYAFNFECHVERAWNRAKIGDWERMDKIPVAGIRFFIDERGGTCTLSELATAVNWHHQYRRSVA